MANRVISEIHFPDGEILRATENRQLQYETEENGSEWVVHYGSTGDILSKWNTIYLAGIVYGPGGVR